MSSIPKTMKAWVVTQAGDPDTALELRTDWPTPESPKGGNIMVKVSCMALNPLDLVVMKYPMLIRGQSIAGADFAGEVIQVGASASVSSDIHLGMTVCGTIPTMQILMGSGGTLAEYIVLPAHMVVEKPKSLGKDAAAGLLGVPGQTCVAILKAASLSKGSRVLVNGASGGVGSVLIQVLQATGIHVTGICSGKNSAMVQRLGAEEVGSISLFSHPLPLDGHHQKIITN